MYGKEGEGEEVREEKEVDGGINKWRIEKVGVGRMGRG